MIVIDSRWSALPPRERQVTLVHEMTHTALDPDTSGRTPPWLVEGVAMYVSGDDRTAEARRARPARARATKLARAREPNSIFRLNGREQGAAYAAGSAAAHAIVARHGTQGLFGLYDAFNDAAIRGRPGARRPTACCAARSGMSLAELEAASPAERLSSSPAMPELPEVETIRRHLAPHVEGRVLTRARGAATRAGAARSRATRSPPRSRAGASRRSARRGKYLIWELEDDVHLMLHLRMTGTLLLDPPAPPRHRRVRFALDDGRELFFDDPRRFGTGELALGGDGARRVLRRAARRRAVLAGLHERAPVRAHAGEPRADQGVPARPAQDRRRGEHLRRRGAVPRAHPPAARRRGGSRASRSRRCATRVVASLEEGLAAKGASIDDFRDPDGVQGSFQDRFLIHLREGEPCLVCGRPVRKLRAAGRGTYVCERCQPRPRASGGDAELGQAPGAVGRGELLKAADRLAVEDAPAGRSSCR